jgi:predicted aldo/keto reductase-like oxidoreductase
MRIMNEIAYWGERGKPRVSFFYDRMVKTPEELEEKKTDKDEFEGAATLCVQCGECLDKCPQQIDIPDIMKKANLIFEEGKKISEMLS